MLFCLLSISLFAVCYSFFYHNRHNRAQKNIYTSPPHQFTSSPPYNETPNTRNTLCPWGFEITDVNTGSSYSF